MSSGLRTERAPPVSRWVGGWPPPVSMAMAGFILYASPEDCVGDPGQGCTGHGFRASLSGSSLPSSIASPHCITSAGSLTSLGCYLLICETGPLCLRSAPSSTVAVAMFWGRPHWPGGTAPQGPEQDGVSQTPVRPRQAGQGLLDQLGNSGDFR